jgi:hypothetical protein
LWKVVCFSVLVKFWTFLRGMICIPWDMWQYTYRRDQEPGGCNECTLLHMSPLTCPVILVFTKNITSCCLDDKGNKALKPVLGCVLLLPISILCDIQNVSLGFN